MNNIQYLFIFIEIIDRYPFTRSRSRPRLKHKINLQMEKNEAEVADRGEI